MKPRRIFITGATGFAGRHLIAALNAGRGAARAEIFGACFPERPESCSDLCAAAPNVRLLHLDLRNDGQAVDAVRAVRPDWIFHLAALSQVRLSWERRREVFDTNLLGTYNLFEAARMHAPKARILFVSSSDVYGFLTPHRRALRETDGGSIVSPYAFTKKSGEILSEFYALCEKVPIIIARPFPHTGPGQTPVFVCADWARQVALIEKYKRHEEEKAGKRGRVTDQRSGMPVMHVGNLALRRDYMDVRDVVRAYILLMKKGRTGEIYNISSGKAPSLEWILKTLIGFSRRKIAYEIDPARVRKVDIPFLAGDSRKIREATGWAPTIPLARTLSDMLDDWRARV
jgi:GDP-4-dehydro-6-deoxy-D-mannose reductase